MDRRRFLVATGAGLAVSAASQSSLKSHDRIVVDGSNSSLINRAFLSQARNGGADCVHKSVHTFLEAGRMWRFVDDNADSAVIATSVAEIVDAKRQGRISFVLGSQHGDELEKLMNKTPMMTRGYLGPALRAFYQLGLRSQGLCYNVTNLFGGGCLEPATPLTREGERLVEQIHTLGMALDVGGHTGERTSLDAIAVSAGVPVICSHTNAAGLVNNARATSDRVMEAIAATGGVIGITAISDFQVRSKDNYVQHGATSPRAELQVMLDQYDYVKKLVGIDHVGMGPDFSGPRDTSTGPKTPSLFLIMS